MKSGPREPRIPAETPENQRPASRSTTCGPYTKEVPMSIGEVRTAHRRVVITFRFDWKSMAVLASAYLIRVPIR